MGTVRGGGVARRRKATPGRRKAAVVAVARAAGPLPKATFASPTMRSGSNRWWTLRALRWPASPSRLGASSGSAGRLALLAGGAEGTRRALYASGSPRCRFRLSSRWLRVVSRLAGIHNSQLASCPAGTLDDNFIVLAHDDVHSRTMLLFSSYMRKLPPLTVSSRPDAGTYA